MVKKALVAPLIALSLSVIAAYPCRSQLADSAWPKFHGDLGNTGRTSIIAQGNRLKWWVSSGGGYEGTSVSVGADGTVYTMAQTGLMAVSPNGSKRWTHQGGPGTCTPAVGRDGTIYYGTHRLNNTQNGMFYAVNPNGTTKWSFSFYGNDYPSSPTIDSLGNLYFGSTYVTGYLYSLRADTGQFNWQVQVGEISSSPAIDHMGRILIGDDSGYISAFDTSGNTCWRNKISGLSRSSPAVSADGTIYIGNLNGRLWALNETGPTRWSKDMGSGMNGTPALGADGTIYTVTGDATLRAFSPNGDALWSYRSPTYHGSSTYFGSPTVDGNGTIYYTSNRAWDAGLIAVNPNGTLKYDTLYSGVVSAPAIGPQGQIYLGGAGGVWCLVPEPSGVLVLVAGALALAGGYNRRRRM